MWQMLWPLMLVVTSNIFYHISQKSTPNNVNAFGSLMLTYLVATLTSALLFVFSAKPQNILTELGKTNWTALALGVALVGLETGFLFLYRAGWKISMASLVANITLACLLVFVGALLYKEVITARQILGMAVCAVGLILITH